jgi:hypothetical protein
VLTARATAYLIELRDEHFAVEWSAIATGVALEAWQYRKLVRDIEDAMPDADYDRDDALRTWVIELGDRIAVLEAAETAA